MASLHVVPRQAGGFVKPKFEMPEWQTSRISALRQQFAAPQVGRMKRQMSPWLLGGDGPQGELDVRGAMRGYGEGLGGILSGAGQLALSQYGQEYGSQFEGAKLGFEAALEKSRADWQTGERTGAEEWRTREREEELWGGVLPGEFGPPGGGPGASGPGVSVGGSLTRRPEKMTQKSLDPNYMRPILKSNPFTSRQKGGPVQPFAYSVGEGGTPSKPKPELVVYKGGRMELVGKKGPEIRTFAKEGEVIPAGKTKKILKNKGLSIVSREKGGRVREKSAGLPLQQKIMQYLTATRFSPSGAGHMPYWQFMLQAQPQKLAGLLSYMQGQKPSFGSGAVSTGPARKQSTRKGFVSEKKGVSKSPSGPGTEGAGAYAELRGFKEPSTKYKRWLGRG